MTYISYYVSLDPANHEIEIARLNRLGVESFIEHEHALEAFIESNQFSSLENEIEAYLNESSFLFEKRIHQAKDWNAEWENNFKPIIINDQLVIRAPFHPELAEYPQELVIAPKMAFGTGHHETTSMILEWMLTQDLEEKEVLDFGCGTGILGIFAAKNLAANVCFIDNDPFAIENVHENSTLNNLNKLDARLGSFDEIPEASYDMILANITRNVLSDGLVQLSNHLKHKAKIIMSGFLRSDGDFMLDKIDQAKLKFIEQKQKNDWLCIIAEKQ